MKEKFYLTTAIAYASRKPHFGNTYEVIMADAVARYKRLRGYDVFFCTGTDEHGQKIENLANEAGVTPQKYVDGVAGEIRGIWDKMNSSYDYFIRTTDANHVAAVQKIFKKFYERATSIRDITRAGTAPPASPSSPKRRWWTANAPTVADLFSRRRRRRTSSR